VSAAEERVVAPRAWIVDDDPGVRWVLEKALKNEGLATRSFEGADDMFVALADEQPDVMITDVRMPGTSGLDLLDRLDNLQYDVPVIVITAHSDLENAVQAFQRGAFEYLPKPFDVDDAVGLVRRALGSTAAEQALTPQIEHPIPAMIGQAPAMQEVFRTIGRLSGSSMSVLVTGESGTGKELIARALHTHSPRSGQTFVALNTTAIASELLESELFGHERGAFTGADARRIGRFEQADGGTLFLDEIGDMSPALQTRLLRVLAEGEFYRVGGQVPIRVDVRIIAATNHDLEIAVADGLFREDLYHRLNVIHIQAPPLRSRRDDIRLLLEHYMAAAARELGEEPKRLSDGALDLLRSFSWPGNVRQLVNACRRLTVTAPGTEIRSEDIPPDLGGRSGGGGATPEWTSALTRWAEQRMDDSATPLLPEAQSEFERALIVTALDRTSGRKQDAARLLGWGRNTLSRKIRELGL
jgi:two-component system nitrogen regulation response regulator GlnG